jgi:hypothetical protein
MAIDNDSIQDLSRIDSRAEAEASKFQDHEVCESDAESRRPVDEMLSGAQSLSEGVDVAFTRSNLTLETSVDAEFAVPEAFKDEVDVPHASENEMVGGFFPREIDEPPIIEGTQALPVDHSRISVDVGVDVLQLSDAESRQVHEISSESEILVDEVSTTMTPNDLAIPSSDFTHLTPNLAAHPGAIAELDTQLPKAALRHSDPFLDTSSSATDATAGESSSIQKGDMPRTLEGSTTQSELEVKETETFGDETSGEQTLTDVPAGSDGVREGSR